MSDHRRRAAWTAALSFLLAGCGGGGGAPEPAAPPSRSATPAPTSPAAGAAAGPCTPMAAVDAWPVERRAAQLVVAPALDGAVAPLEGSIAQGIGGVLILGSAPAGLAQQVARAGAAAAVPLMVMADQEGGGVQRLSPPAESLPWPRDMVRTMSTEAVRAAAARVGAQLRAAGVTVDLAPVLDLDAGPGPDANDPDGPRSFSADPATATTYGLAFAEGLRQGGVLPVVKHFPGLGGASPNTDFGPASTAPLPSLERAGLLPFEAAVRDGLPAVMVAHATVPGLTAGPASLSSSAITGLLRGRLAFGGLVVTDSLSAGAVSAAGETVPAAAEAAIAAGADMVLFGSTLTPEQTRLLAPDRVAATVAGIVAALAGAVRDGRLLSQRLDEAVVHVLTAKGVDPCAGSAR